MGQRIGEVVSAAGTLDDSRIVKREILYTGMNGRHVERFYLSPTESYVFKPVTHSGQRGREAWVYDQVLGSLPPIYPRMLARSGESAPENGSWVIYEDLGRLQHTFREEIVLQVVEEMARWHASPVERWNEAPMRGPKPPIEEIAGGLLRSSDTLAELLPSPGAAGMLQELLRRLESHTWSGRRVLSHGDLHLGNYAPLNGRVVVLDWEHAHLNVPCWDLYHLVDLSHPVFPKTVTEALRERLLDTYLDCSGERSELGRSAFKQEYYLFSAAFSLWMLGLIAGDLRRQSGPWDVSELESQREETLENFIQCARHIA
ncbi:MULTISPECIES: phosphotransferase family protein [Paenibacillus]|uniref:phosphotransferase family protein n=1 Tax=Paenibacillus TaxID=44249 RepID=UPI0022B8F122|nr:phosphotransferase [Paenibacillus caseinilyticus]MCZ8522076.1 phosphotransferase [Paenibacillus caseinilyticus]